ncbi:hypothetical protein [Sphingomonas turrisvirgatae]|uniref:Uncharacterized protein n=1 Tax=Sphingomonas turrisvirgatae TaxID=1888892 RepID=A0A1E3LZQ0_9SPHN|nr:hypothetical protein [Sphingomonas turrisvirgatae]ODP39272.1 hypothetical protein BFL28_10690 [Sphingomonas turrisvirgatae]
MRGRGRPQASRYGSAEMTGAQHKAQLTRLLYECRPHMLDRYTVDELLRTHSKVPRREVEYLLTIARQKRAGEARG